ncbi:MAG: ester cyclase [Maribacter sp.]|nr:ester cyclase [Maribacter sp.]NNK19383.1 SnoaL-like domain-containing protein [Maribacter sp.]
MKRTRLISIILVLLVSSCNINSEKHKAEAIDLAMRENFESFINNAWNKKNMDSLRSISITNYNRQLNGINVAENLNELEANMNIYFQGFPDLKVSILDTAIKNNRLFAQWTFEGTNTGVFGETPATGKHVIVSGFSELTFDDEGKISQEKVYYNELQLLQQLGYTLNEPIVE